MDQVITLRIGRKLYKKLQKYALKNQLPMSLVIRRGLSEKLKRVHI